MEKTYEIRNKKGFREKALFCYLSIAGRHFESGRSTQVTCTNIYLIVLTQ